MCRYVRLVISGLITLLNMYIHLWDRVLVVDVVYVYWLNVCSWYRCIMALIMFYVYNVVITVYVGSEIEQLW